MITKEALNISLTERLSPEQAIWFQSSLANILSEASDSVSMEHYLFYSAIAKRKLGHLAIKVGGEFSWCMDEIGRLCLLLKFLDRYPRDKHPDRLNEIYRLVDENEKQVIAKSMSILDGEGRAVDLAISIGRTNNIHLFSSLALHNPYPTTFYDDRAYGQLVLKALFMDLDIGGIFGLERRLNPALSLLCMDLAKERLAANRTPPDSIWLAINFEDICSEDKEVYLSFIKKTNPYKV